MLHVLLMVPLAFIYSAILEWLIHKYILHGLGKNKKSFWSFHWHSHHKTCRKNKNSDINYKFPGAPPVKKEIISLMGYYMQREGIQNPAQYYFSQ